MLKKEGSKLTHSKRHLYSTIDKLGVGKFVLDLYKERLPATVISQRLRTDKGIELSPLAVNRWLNSRRKQDVETAEKFNVEEYKKLALNYQQEIKDILDEVKEIKAQAIMDNKLDTYTKLVSRLYQGIELMAKLMGDIKPQGSVDINVFINEINKQVFEEKKSNRKTLFSKDNVIDVEAEIIDDDKKHESHIQGEKSW